MMTTGKDEEGIFRFFGIDPANITAADRAQVDLHARWLKYTQVSWRKNNRYICIFIFAFFPLCLMPFNLPMSSLLAIESPLDIDRPPLVEGGWGSHGPQQGQCQDAHPPGDTCCTRGGPCRCSIRVDLLFEPPLWTSPSIKPPRFFSQKGISLFSRTVFFFLSLCLASFSCMILFFFWCVFEIKYHSCTTKPGQESKILLYGAIHFVVLPMTRE